MNNETIVAVYETAAQADVAIRDLEAADVPSSAISRASSTTGSIHTESAPRDRGQGFWSSLFVGEPDHDTAVYDRSIENGSHVVTVQVPETQATSVTRILERHNPVDIEDRATGYGRDTRTTATMFGHDTTDAGVGAVRGTTASAEETLETKAIGVDGLQATAMHEAEEAIPLAEERINVGKRLINRGTTRVRRFVVETPVEESVTLHAERVSVERRTVPSDARAADVEFTDKTIEMTESDEKVIVDKTARVREEVVIRKDISDRIETVRDSVRREDVEITKDGMQDRAAGHGTGPVLADRH